MNFTRFSYLYGFLLAFSLSACTLNTSDEQSLEAAPEAEVVGDSEDLNNPPPEIVPSDIDFNEVIYSEGSTWEDIHAYYQEKLPEHQGAPYYHNLQNTVLVHLLSRDGFYETAGNEVVANYVQQILQMPFFNAPELTARCLLTLQGHWTDEEIKATANQAYDQTVKYIQTNFSPEAQGRIMKLQKEPLGQLKELGISS